MSNQASRNAKLLHADEEQLDRAAIPISDGTAFVVLICPAEARAAALSRLRGRLKGFALPDPVELGTPDEMLAALVEQAARRDRVLSVVLGRDVDGALDAMNLHREKLLAGGPVLVWLEDVAALQRVRERAPDAYSFRSTLVVVRGDGGPLPLPSAEEPEVVATARKRLKRARRPLDKAAAGLQLAEIFRVTGKYEQAEAVAREALQTMSSASNDDERELRSELCRTIAAVNARLGKAALALHWFQRAQAELHMESLARELEHSVRNWVEWPGPFRERDRSKANKARETVASYGLSRQAQSMSLTAVASMAAIQGDLKRARRFVSEAHTTGFHDLLHDINRLWTLGNIEVRDGDLTRAEAIYREAIAMASQTSRTDAMHGITLALMACMQLRSELEAAERLVPEDSDALTMRRFFRGDVNGALETIREQLKAAANASCDKFIVHACGDIQSFAIEAIDAERLTPEVLGTLAADLALAQDVLLSIAGSHGPAWYPIQIRTRRAEVFSLSPDKLSDALTLDREALDLARRTYPDLLPATGRILADHLLLANQPDEALAVIADIEPLALETGFLEERARLLADRLLALVQKNEPLATLEPHLEKFRESLASTDSKRITAETLRALAQRLPPTTTTPDPFALADEAHRLFLAMPIPAEEARCLEIMADVLVARGRPEEAKVRYRTARARLERHGLLLRVPKLNEKLEKLG